MASLTDAKAYRRSSSSVNNATATLRVSVSDVVNTHGKDQQAEKARQESADKARNRRRKSSLLQMGVANTVIKDAASMVLKEEVAVTTEDEIDDDASPIEKLQTLLTKAKERGMSAERLFEHFAPEGEKSVTPAMFETALRKLGQRAFDLDEMDLEHLMSAFDSDGNGSVELEGFMTFCLSIPSLPWRAEKVRRLTNAESKDELNVAARKVARRRSSLRAVAIGKLVHQGSRFFWRSKETIDVAFHYNSDEGLITISTRCLERAYNYPAMFVDVSKIPVLKSAVAAKAESAEDFEAMGDDEKKEATDEAVTALRVEYLQHRIKVPDEVNGPEGEAADCSEINQSTGGSSSSSSDEDSRNTAKEGSRKAATTAKGVAAAPPTGVVSLSALAGMTAVKERADDKAKHRPFLAKMSTDTWDTLLCARNIVLQTPHRFQASGRRSSMDDFRRASLDFEKLAKETEKLSILASNKATKLEESIDSISSVKDPPV